jgi:hypothetical protein
MPSPTQAQPAASVRPATVRGSACRAEPLDKDAAARCAVKVLCARWMGNALRVRRTLLASRMLVAPARWIAPGASPSALRAPTKIAAARARTGRPATARVRVKRAVLKDKCAAAARATPARSAMRRRPPVSRAVRAPTATQVTLASSACGPATTERPSAVPWARGRAAATAGQVTLAMDQEHASRAAAMASLAVAAAVATALRATRRPRSVRRRARRTKSAPPRTAVAPARRSAKKASPSA